MKEIDNKLKIFICSPYRGDIEHNSEVAKYWCKQVICDGNLPVAPHLYFPQFLDDTDPEQRKMGLTLSINLLKNCDELWICSNTTSAGMYGELAAAIKYNIPIVDKSITNI